MFFFLDLNNPLVLMNLVLIIVCAILVVILGVFLYYAQPLMGVIIARMKKWDVALVEQQDGKGKFLPARYRAGMLIFKNGAAIPTRKARPIWIKGTPIFVINDKYGIILNNDIVSAFNIAKDYGVKVLVKEGNPEPVVETIKIDNILQFKLIEESLKQKIKEIKARLGYIELSEDEKKLLGIEEVKLNEKERKKLEEELKELESKYNAFINAIAEIPAVHVVRFKDILDFVTSEIPVSSILAEVDERFVEIMEDYRNPLNWMKYLIPAGIFLFLVLMGLAMLKGSFAPIPPPAPAPAPAPHPAPSSGIVIK